MSAPSLVASTAASRANARNTSIVGRTQTSASLDPAVSGLLQILEHERLLRQASSHRELHALLANELPKLVRAQQAFVFEVRGRALPVLRAITGLAAVDRTVPLVRAFEHLAAAAVSTARPAGPIAREALSPDVLLDLARYPHQAMLWLPLVAPDGAVLGAVLLSRDLPWSDAETTIAARVSATAAHAIDALLRRRRRLSLSAWLNPTRLGVLCAVLALMLFLPVPLTVLAPFEIGPRGAQIVTAGVDGVIDSVEINPNNTVRAGDVLVRLVDVAARNRLHLAEREVIVAEARIKKWQQLAFSDTRANHELAIAGAELTLKRAERDWAREQLALVEIRALAPGLILFSDKRDLVGKPVSIGEKVMEIADPSSVEARVDVSTGDGLVLDTGASVRLFLDTEPLAPRAGRIVRADHQPRTLPSGALAFRATAELDGVPLRIGTRGTAQIFGASVPLGAYLFRRPAAQFRQWIGL